jgi:uncharacterized membrane protein YraQ (UPF0718 family)
MSKLFNFFKNYWFFLTLLPIWITLSLFAVQSLTELTPLLSIIASTLIGIIISLLFKLGDEKVFYGPYRDIKKYNDIESFKRDIRSHYPTYEYHQRGLIYTSIVLFIIGVVIILTSFFYFNSNHSSNDVWQYWVNFVGLFGGGWTIFSIGLSISYSIDASVKSEYYRKLDMLLAKEEANKKPVLLDKPPIVVENIIYRVKKKKKRKK